MNSEVVTMQWKLLRISKRITLTEIAKTMSVSVSYLSQFESGKLQLSHKHMEIYCNYITVTDKTKRGR
jgi:transcriptional regulator with XRE-family HTH domain